MIIRTYVTIEHQETNLYVHPEPPKGYDGVEMVADNLGNGCCDAAIAFSHHFIHDPATAIEDGTCLVGFKVSKERLKEIINALTLVYENI